jgi:2-dehydropantoate 2-reductase
MKILVLGAGATGGYFGGRLLEAGRDVSFLVRRARAERLRSGGLVIRSPAGDAKLAPRVLTRATLDGDYDLVILACKAYDLVAAIDAIAPAVGPATAVLPLLNGLRHYDALDARFGAERVLGGLCSIAVTLDAHGHVEHLAPMHVLRFGERSGERTSHVAALEQVFAGTKLDAKPSRDIVQALWEKWVMLASLAGMTCLMRAAIGDIVAAPCGEKLMRQMLDECSAVAAAHGRRPRDAVLADTQELLTRPASTFTASMLRDVESRHRVEADHILGDLIERAAAKSIDTPLLRIAYCHLKAYEARLQRSA